MKPDSAGSLQTHRLLFKAFEKVHTPALSSSNFRIEKTAQLQEEPEDRNDDDVVKKIPNPLHDNRGADRVLVFPRS